MSMPTASSSEQNTLPGAITDLIVAFMRAINTARLYASGHELFKTHTQQPYVKLREAMADRDSLFLGFARNAIFLEGSFYQVKELNLQKFLRFFHSLGISYMLMGKQITGDELQSLIGLLAGAKQGQGSEVSSALASENVKNAKVGFLDYTIFATVQAVASQLSQTRQDEGIWRQLILQPAGAGAFSLSQEQAKQLAKICEDMEELKKLLVQMNASMAGVTPAHKGILLGNFIQNVSDILSRVDPAKRKPFALQLIGVLDSLEAHLKIQILGSVTPGALMDEESDIIREILGALSDGQLVHLLGDAIKETGTKSACFGNLFNRALARHKEPGLLLSSVRQEMDRATQEGNPGALGRWQQLEQLLIRQQETEEFNERYRKEIEALASSISINALAAEKQEMARLLKTLTLESLRPAKAQLIIDLISQPHTAQSNVFVPPLLERLGDLLRHFLSQGDYLTAGNLLRNVLLALSDYSENGAIKETMSSLLTTEDIQLLLRGLLERCRTYEPRETAAISAVCQLYPVKAGDLLLDVLVDLGDDHSHQARWVLATLTLLGPRLSKLLNRRLLSSPDHVLPPLLKLAAVCGDTNLAPTVRKLLENPNHEIRLNAVRALGAVRADEAVPRLAEIVLQKSWVRTKKAKLLQVAAVHSLAEIGTHKARQVLHQVIKQGSGDLRAACQELI